jgi:hypothetical protein
MPIKCPTCKYGETIPQVDPHETWTHTRVCVRCGAKFTPLRIPPARFVEIESANRRARSQETSEIGNLLDDRELRVKREKRIIKSEGIG